MIYKVSWYNEDAYGWMEHISIILQSDLNKTKVFEEAISLIREKYPKIDFDQYEHTEVLNITNDKVLSISMGTL